MGMESNRMTTSPLGGAKGFEPPQTYAPTKFLSAGCGFLTLSSHAIQLSSNSPKPAREFVLLRKLSWLHAS